MLDPTALVALEQAPRLVAKQFSEDPPAPRRTPKAPLGKPVRAHLARALRIVADALEPAPQRHPAS